MTTNNENTENKSIEQLLNVFDKNLENYDNIIDNAQENLNIISTIKNEFTHITNVPIAFASNVHVPEPVMAIIDDNTEDETIEQMLELCNNNLNKYDNIIDTAHENLNIIKNKVTNIMNTPIDDGNKNN